MSYETYRLSRVSRPQSDLRPNYSRKQPGRDTISSHTQSFTSWAGAERDGGSDFRDSQVLEIRTGNTTIALSIRPNEPPRLILPSSHTEADPRAFGTERLSGGRSYYQRGLETDKPPDQAYTFRREQLSDGVRRVRSYDDWFSKEKSNVAEKDSDVTGQGSDGDSDGDSDGPKHLTGYKLFVLLSCVTVVLFLVLMDVSVLSAALPKITNEFHSLADAGWYGAVFSLATAALQPLSGKFYMTFSAKWTFLTFFFMFEAGSLISGVSQSSNMFIGGQCVSGLGASGLINGAIIIIGGAAPAEKRPLYQGIVVGLGEMGLVMGPLIGGVLTQYTIWRWCFYINLPIGAVCSLALVWVPVPELVPKPKLSFQVFRGLLPELDLLGFAIFAPAAVLFLLALQFGGAGAYEWKSPVIIGLFVGSAVAAILLVLWEKKMGARAMIPGALLKRPIVCFATAHFGLVLSSVAVSGYYLPTYFQTVLGQGATMSGVSTLPGAISQLIFIMATGGLLKKVGYYMPFALASGVLNTVGSALLGTLKPDTPTALWIGYQVISGAGRGMGIQMGMVAIQHTVADGLAPLAVALMMFGQSFLGAVLLVVASTIFNLSLSVEVPLRVPSVPYDAVLAAGTDPEALRRLVPGGGPELTGLLLAYSNSIDNVFWMVTALAGASFLAAFGLGWHNIKVPKHEPERSPEDAGPGHAAPTSRDGLASDKILNERDDGHTWSVEEESRPCSYCGHRRSRETDRWPLA